MENYDTARNFLHLKIIGHVTTTIWFHLLLNNVLRTLFSFTYTKIESLHILIPNGYVFILLSAWIQLIFHFTTSSDFWKLQITDSKFEVSIIRYVIASVFCCNSALLCFLIMNIWLFKNTMGNIKMLRNYH